MELQATMYLQRYSFNSSSLFLLVNDFAVCDNGAMKTVGETSEIFYTVKKTELFSRTKLQNQLML